MGTLDVGLSDHQACHVHRPNGDAQTRQNSGTEKFACMHLAQHELQKLQVVGDISVIKSCRVTASIVAVKAITPSLPLPLAPTPPPFFPRGAPFRPRCHPQ